MGGSVFFVGGVCLVRPVDSDFLRLVSMMQQYAFRADLQIGGLYGR